MLRLFKQLRRWAADLAPHEKYHNRLSFTLAFVAGVCEAACFVGLFHTFTTFITGTLMILFIELAEGNPGYIVKAIVFVSFFVFTVLWVFVIRLWPWHRAKRRFVLLSLEAVLILVFAVVGMLAGELQSAGALNTLVVSIAAVFAMTLHSTIYFVLLKGYPPSHFMTGNLTNFSIGIVDMVIEARKPGTYGAEQMQGAQFMAWYYPAVISLFVAGVIVGAVGYLSLGFVILIVPAAAVVLAAILARRLDTPGGEIGDGLGEET